MPSSRRALIRFEKWLERNSGPRSVKGWLNDRYCAGVSFTVLLQDEGWGVARRVLPCLLLGHRDVQEVLHEEICEHPWNQRHAEETRHVVERWCRSCDGGFLSSRRLG